MEFINNLIKEGKYSKKSQPHCKKGTTRRHLLNTATTPPYKHTQAKKFKIRKTQSNKIDKCDKQK